jgi:tetratricopeptide (TPR) repeat protein
MSYAGNPSLAPDVQKRILDTFRHTLDVAARGSLEEARLGCDFILQLDSQFTPAHTLSERLRGASGPLALDDLRARLDGVPAAPAVTPAAAPRPAPAPAVAPPAQPRPAAAPTQPRPAQPPPAAPPAGAGDLRRQLAQLLMRRDFESLAGLAKREHAAIADSSDLQGLMAQAQELMEAAPYVDRFLSKARNAVAAGQLDEARSLVDKARTLDDGHPAIAELASQLGAAPPRAAAPPPAARPSAAPPPPAAPAFAASLDEPLVSEPVPDPAATYELPADETSFGDLPSDDDLAMDLPPLELGDVAPSLHDELGPAFHDELSLEGLAADTPVATPAAAGGASDPDPRIAELLDEGQAQFARGELQGAIDAWSRIFLIDIDHAEAAHRIDQARNAKAEHERQVEEAYHDALAQVQAKDVDGAKETLRHVLALQPNHVAAREALGKLERGELADLPKPPTASGEAALLDELAAAGADDLKEEILVPPEPGTERARPLPAAAVKAPASRRTLLIAVAGVLVVLLAAGWFLMTRWSTLFPNTEPPPRQTTAAEQTPITRATALYKGGQRAVAVAQLKRVPPASPYYEEAQALIGQWEQEESGGQQAAGPSPEQVAKRDALIEQARQAEGERRNLAVAPLLAQAAAISPLSDDEQALGERAKKAIEPLQPILTLLRAEEYDRSLRDLWVVLEKDTGNTDARLMLTTAYYNKGVLSLQQGKPDEAEENLKEAAGLSPGDVDVERLLQFTRTYQARNPDLLYRIYTKYLTPRPL